MLICILGASTLQNYCPQVEIQIMIVAWWNDCRFKTILTFQLPLRHCSECAGSKNVSNTRKINWFELRRANKPKSVKRKCCKIMHNWTQNFAWVIHLLYPCIPGQSISEKAILHHIGRHRYTILKEGHSKADIHMLGAGISGGKRYALLSLMTVKSQLPAAGEGALKIMISIIPHHPTSSVIIIHIIIHDHPTSSSIIRRQIIAQTWQTWLRQIRWPADMRAEYSMRFMRVWTFSMTWVIATCTRTQYDGFYTGWVSWSPQQQFWVGGFVFSFDLSIGFYNPNLRIAMATHACRCDSLGDLELEMQPEKFLIWVWVKQWTNQ